LLPQEVAGFWSRQGAADVQGRADWHAFQLIGDVLRSEDLASTAQHDAAFLQTLRSRLAQEPVVLAPEPVQSPLPRASLARRSWTWPSAAAVGVVMVSAAVWNARDVAAPGALTAVTVAQSGVGGSSAPAIPVAAQPALVAAPGGQPIDQGGLLRDPQIDRYLAAHQQFVGTSALGAPSGFIRNAAVDVPRH
jgi:sigma-E factor negative regulatory protein RseA